MKTGQPDRRYTNMLSRLAGGFGRIKKMAQVSFLMLLGISCLSGCAAFAYKEDIPQLLEPIEISLKGKRVLQGDIYDMEAYKGSVKSDHVSYAFSQACAVEDMVVHVGQYIEKGDLLARVNTNAYEKELADLKAEISYLTTLNHIETQLADNRIENSRLELQLMRPGSQAYENMQKQIEAFEEQKAFEEKEREFVIEEKQTELNSFYRQNGSQDLYASESGYLTYVKDFSADNPSGQVNANEIVAVTAKDDSYYIASDMPLVTAREAASVYAKMGEKQYPLTYLPYEESELKWAAKEGITLESRFTCEEDIRSLMGREVTVYALSNYREDVLSISPDALFAENNASFVYLLKEGKKIKQEVETGVHTKNAVEIRSGLEAGEEVYSSSGDIPSSNYQSITVEKSKLDITKRYDTAKAVYPMVSQIVNEIEGARVKEICVKNGQKVTAGDTIAVLEAGAQTSAVLENHVDIAALQRNYEYEMALYQNEWEELQEQKTQIIEKETTGTLVYKKLLLEIRTLQLNMEKETAVYTYETERLQRESAKNRKENGQIYVKADREGVVKELASLSEGYSLAKHTLVCKIADDSFSCIKLFAEGVTLPVGSRVTVVTGNQEELTGTVVSSVPDAQGAIYQNGMYINETSSQTKDAVYIVLDNEEDYEKLKSFGVEVSVWNVEDAIVIDKDCIYTQGDKNTGKRYVWVIEDGALSKRYVTLGYIDSDVAWVVQGLSEGEQIILEKAEEEAE